MNDPFERNEEREAQARAMLQELRTELALQRRALELVVERVSDIPEPIDYSRDIGGLSKLTAKRLCDPINRCLGSAIGRMSWVGAQAFNRADVYDRATGFDQMGEGMFYQHERCCQIDLNRVCPVPLAKFKCCAFFHQSGIVD